ncbi:MAG: hypothetical protein E7222_14780 [Clostridiales bacterium]|nr:hypothetical protein [Clostridiales bacterium]
MANYDFYGKVTKCVLGIGFEAVKKANMNAENNEVFCFNPIEKTNDDLGMIKYGRLIIPATGLYRLTVNAHIAASINDNVTLGFDYMNDSNTGKAGHDASFPQITLSGATNSDNTVSMTDIVKLTEGQQFGCLYTISNGEVTAYRPTITIERLA